MLLSELQYEIYKRKRDKERRKPEKEARSRGAVAFNGGVWDSLPFWAKWKFMFLKKDVEEE